MDIQFTQDFITAYAKRNKRHPKYQITNDWYKALKVHADGEAPGDLLTTQRPGESAHIKKYRISIYQPITKGVVAKVINSLAKIRRSEDWTINYEGKKAPTTIGKDETLQIYCEEQFPTFISLTDWLFNVGLKQYLIDPNAVILVYAQPTASATERPQPTLTIFNSDQVLDYVEGQYAVLLSADQCSYKEGNTVKDDGSIYIVPTGTECHIFTQASSDGKFNVETYSHTTGMVPVFKLGGAIQSAKQGLLYESRISGMLPGLNSAVIDYSDKQAEKVQHVHSLMWQYQTQKCGNCKGTGVIPQSGINAAPIECPVCKGQTTVPTSPYETLVINSNTVGIGQNPVPTPMAGYIQKADVALMLKALSDEVKSSINDALASINMEFLVDDAQSGVAKAYDRDELNNFVHSIASDLVTILNHAYYMIAKTRYGYTVTDDKAIRAMCPTIPIPNKFDLLSSNYIIDELAQLRNAKVDPSVIAMLEQEFAAKKFRDNTEAQNLIAYVFNLNPLSGMNTDDKVQAIMNGGIDPLDYITSCNIVAFIKRAISENSGFTTMSETQQKAIIQKYALEKQAEINGEKDLKAPATKPQPQPQPAN